MKSSHGFIQQSSLSPHGQLCIPQIKEPAHSESSSQSPSPSPQMLPFISLQHSSLPSFCQSRSDLGRQDAVKVEQTYIWHISFRQQGMQNYQPVIVVVIVVEVVVVVVLAVVVAVAVGARMSYFLVKQGQSRCFS